MSQQALTILHQHAIQGDVTVLQSYVVRWIAFAGKLPDKSMHFSVLYNILNDLESHWATEPLSREEVQHRNTLSAARATCYTPDIDPVGTFIIWPVPGSYADGPIHSPE